MGWEMTATLKAIQKALCGFNSPFDGTWHTTHPNKCNLSLLDKLLNMLHQNRNGQETSYEI